MVEFKERTSPAALSYAAVTSEPAEQPEPATETEEALWSAERENKFLWRLLWMAAICWNVTLFMAMLMERG